MALCTARRTAACVALLAVSLGLHGCGKENEKDVDCGSVVLDPDSAEAALKCDEGATCDAGSDQCQELLRTASLECADSDKPDAEPAGSDPPAADGKRAKNKGLARVRQPLKKLKHKVDCLADSVRLRLHIGRKNAKKDKSKQSDGDHHASLAVAAAGAAPLAAGSITTASLLGMVAAASVLLAAVTYVRQRRRGARDAVTAERTVELGQPVNA